MRLLSNLHVKGKPAVLPDRAIRRQSHYFIYRPRTLQITQFIPDPDKHLFDVSHKFVCCLLLLYHDLKFSEQENSPTVGIKIE